MKASNAVIGGKVQIKRACRSHSKEAIAKGLVCTVSRVLGESYELRLKHPDIAYGFAWVNASDCRKYIEPDDEVMEDAPVIPTHSYQVGADVQVGDWLVCSKTDGTLVEGVAYCVLGFDTGGYLISNPVGDDPYWVARYYAFYYRFNKVLREVQPNATDKTT